VTLSGALLHDDEFLSSFEYNPERKAYAREIKLITNRWLCVPDDDKNDTICYDLNSFKFTKRAKESMFFGEGGLSYDAFTSLQEASIAHELEALTGLPPTEPTERQGYPTKCIKCGQDTVQGEMTVAAVGGYSSIGLGRAACFNCMIRYSLTDKRWECMKPTACENCYRCSAEVQAPDYSCTESHAPESQYSFNTPSVEEKKLAKAKNKQIYIELRCKKKAVKGV